jgi:hypothetical protein
VYLNINWNDKNKKMKKVNLIILFMLSSFGLFAQNLSMSQLMEIRMKSLGDAEEYLTGKGWEFLNAEDENSERLGYATFSYEKDYMSDLAASFLSFYYSEYLDVKRISIQVNKIEKYNEYLNAIKSYKCKMILSTVENGNLVKVYRGATTTFKITSSTSENSFNVESANWQIFVLSNDDYDLNWGSK